MLSRERILAVLLAVAAALVVFLPIEMGWITDLSEFAALVISGLAVAMLVAAGAMWWRSGSRQRRTEVATGLCWDHAICSPGADALAIYLLREHYLSECRRI